MNHPGLAQPYACPCKPKSNLLPDRRSAMPPKSLTKLRRAKVPARETPLSRRYRAILEKWVPVGLQYFEEWPQRPNCGHFFGGCHWYGSDTAGPLFAFAALASSPQYDAPKTGCSRKEPIKVPAFHASQMRLSWRNGRVLSLSVLILSPRLSPTKTAANAKRIW